MLQIIKKRKAKKSQKDLGQKLQALLSELVWIEGEWALGRVCDFFNTLDAALSKLTEAEKEVAPAPLLKVIRTTQRCGENGYGWFRFDEGKEAHSANTYIVPTGDYSEIFVPRRVDALMSDEAASDQCGFEEGPTLDKDFYKSRFVEPFVLDKYRALRSACEQLAAVAPYR